MGLSKTVYLFPKKCIMLDYITTTDDKSYWERSHVAQKLKVSKPCIPE